LVLVEDDRILIKDQTAAYRNGIYVVQSSGAPIRATDADTAAKLGYAYVSVSVEDPTYPNSAWVLTQTSDEITLETTDLTWALAYNVDLSPYILGTGTAGKLVLWGTDKILTNSSIREANSRVTVGTAAAKAEIATLQTVSGETGSGGTRSLVENQGNSSGGAGAIFDVYTGATLVSSMELKVNNAGLTVISSGTTGSRTAFFSDNGTTTTLAHPVEIQPPATGTQAVPKNLVALLDGSQAFTGIQQGITPVAADPDTTLTTKVYVANQIAAHVINPLTNFVLFDSVISSYSWPVPAGISIVIVEAWGGGSGGNPTDGGGAGGYAKRFVNTTGVTNLVITVGAGSVGANSPSAGDTSTVLADATTVVTANGGGGAGIITGGTGNIHSGVGETITGGIGGEHPTSGSMGGTAGRGGGGGGTRGAAAVGSNGQAPGGGGGSGQTGTQQGGDGAHGRVTLTY
jgi:hypothetical protein